MCDALPKLNLDVRSLIDRARREFGKRAGDVTINLPFISFAVAPKDKEKTAAREIVVRLADRRVLSAKECCDGCIDSALGSLQEIRGLLVDTQVELSDLSDGPLFLLMDMMREGIRQFLTLEERLASLPQNLDGPHDFRRRPDARGAYFAALETLRGHLHRCIGQVAAIADIELPYVRGQINYLPEWDESIYLPPETDGDPA